MDINRRIPHEQVMVTDDGLADDVHVVEDTEAHVAFSAPDPAKVHNQAPDDLAPDDVHVVEDTEAHVHLTTTTDDLTVNPGTGGDFAPRRPSTGGELIDENDVEAHVQLTSDDLTVNPGTGGDVAPRRPSTGGEFIDENDVEGHLL